MLNTAKTIKSRISGLPNYQVCGAVTEVKGPAVYAQMDGVAVGDTVMIERSAHAKATSLLAEVAGFNEKSIVLCPYGPTSGISPGAPVRSTHTENTIEIGEALLGTVVDHLAKPISANINKTKTLHYHPRTPASISPLDRTPISVQLLTGIKSIDSFIPIGKGQRLAVYAEPGVGKTTLLSAITRNIESDVIVYALIGERGREVQALVSKELPEDARKRTIVVASTSDEAAARRANAAQTAISIADYFRSLGKDVLLLVDSLTRLVRAYREIGLAAGEIPVRRGYPPSAFEKMPRLIEQAGNTSSGSITALFTVLLSSDFDEDPMVEEIKGLTDGHIMLSKELAEGGHYPAIAIDESLSRLESTLMPNSLREDISLLRSLWAKNRREGELSMFTDSPDRDLVISQKISKKLANLLTQKRHERVDFSEMKQELRLLAEEARLLQNP